MIELLHGDCLERLRELPDCSVDACVTDPPYGIAFMQSKWDYDVPSVEIWQQVFRVLKPGGHLLAFAGTRTQHRMAVRIEDAGFEIRDMIAWVYGSGFPKSLDVSKAIDRAAGAEREVTKRHIQSATRPDEHAGASAHITMPNSWNITAPATPEAQQWAGWGTALKPALEPITMARKPFKGTVAACVLEHGTGAINVNGCRIGSKGGTKRSEQAPYAKSGWRTGHEVLELNAGRWPANLIHDGSEEVIELFPEVKWQVGMKKDTGGFRFIAGDTDSKQSFTQGRTDSGSAARFFYCAKASKADRDDGNTHPTVKPTDLMRYLCRLVTPPGGVVLDPFMGSGSTGKAAALEGFKFIGIEREAEYLEIARQRVQVGDVQGSLL